MKAQEPLRILFVADHLKFGGAERHLVSLATGLAAMGHEVAVAYLKPYDELLGELKLGGVTQVVCCRSRGGVDLKAIRCLATLIQDFQPQVVAATTQYSLMFSVLATTWSRRKTALLFICHSMEHIQRTQSDRLRFFVYRRFYRMATHIVFVSDTQRQFFQRLGVHSRSDEVIHNGIDLNRFSARIVEAEANQLRCALGFTKNDFVIGICAVFREEKRQVDLLQALRRLRDKGVHAKLLLIGDGIMRPQIENLRDELELQDAVVLCGFQLDVRPFVAACDVMALTSHAETFPIATLEYMALGKPLVASDVGGLCEQVTHGHNGLLYIAGDIDGLTDCLAQLSPHELRQSMGHAARLEVEARFSLPKMIERFRQTCSTLALQYDSPIGRYPKSECMASLLTETKLPHHRLRK